MVGGLLCDVSVSNDADVAVAARMSGGGAGKPCTWNLSIDIMRDAYLAHATSNLT